jgi:hypothetical protein
VWGTCGDTLEQWHYVVYLGVQTPSCSAIWRGGGLHYFDLSLVSLRSVWGQEAVNDEMLGLENVNALGLENNVNACFLCGLRLEMWYGPTFVRYATR